MEEWGYYVTDCKLAAGVKYNSGPHFRIVDLTKIFTLVTALTALPLDNFKCKL